MMITNYDNKPTMITITDANVSVQTLATSGQSATAKGFDPKHRMRSFHQQGDCNRVHFLWDLLDQIKDYLPTKEKWQWGFSAHI